MQKRLAWVVFFSSLLAVFWTVGCSDDSVENSSSSSKGGSGGANGTGADGNGGDCLLGCGAGGGVGGNTQGVIIIDPQNVVLDVVDTTIPTQAFTATLNGQDVTANVTWIYERPDVGDMNADIFEPTGLVGGAATLTAQWNNASGNTTVSVNIEKTLNTGGLTQGEIDAFNNPSGADPSMVLLYPYDETVFPLGVLAPEIQWNGAGGGDLYKLTMTEQFYTYTEYFTVSPPARHLVSEADWTNVGSSGAGAQSDPVTVSIQRQSGGQAYDPLLQTWHIAQGRLKGSVYYWELPDACGSGSGRILRIKPDSPTVDQFYQTNTCYGCHTVSRDGSTMAAGFSNGSPFPFQTIDLTQDPAVLGSLTAAAGVGGTFAAFNDLGDKLLVSNDGGPNNDLSIHDSATGAMLAPNVFGANCGEPAWSPDGAKLAGICGVSTSSWIFDSSNGDLQVADIAADGVTVSNIQTIVPKAGGVGRPAYPSFSPGSEWLAFGRPTAGSRSTGDGKLWLVAPDGADLKELAIASSDNRSFNPVFAPLRAGGYFWLVFITRRDYGNTIVGANRQQLWITAITDPPSAADPSNPPFYLRGQETCGKSENAYYALDPCKELGEDCTSGIDCCNGTCIKDPNTGDYVCGEPPDPGECAQDGNSCETTADCCNAPSSECVDGFCQPDIPK